MAWWRKHFTKHNINIFYAFFNVNIFYGKLGKQYGTFYLSTIKENIF